MEALFKKYNYPSKDKFYKLAKKEGLKITFKDIETFLNKQNVNQVFSRKIIQKKGYIVAFNPEERIQMDLVDMTKFKTRNKNYGWILLLIDVFTRKAYAYMLKNKTETNIEEILKQFFEKHKPDVIISDNESAFKSKIIQKILNDNEIYHDMVEPQDHKALGIIDRLVQTIKNALYKYMNDEETTYYLDELPRIIKGYNDTPNVGIKNISPNDADEKDKIEILQILNHEKDLINKRNRIKFNIGDTVRVKVKDNPFKRSFDTKYSHDQFTIEKIENRKATLNNGDIVSLRRLIKTEKVEIKKNNVLGQALKEHKIQRKVKKELKQLDTGTPAEPILGKRIRKPRVIVSV